MSTTYQYKMMARPFDIGTYPQNGFIRFVSGGVKRIDGYHAIIEYSEKLPAEDVSRYDLKPANFLEFDPINLEKKLKDDGFPDFICSQAIEGLLLFKMLKTIFGL